MNDRRAKIGEDLMEAKIKGLVHKRARQTHGRGPRNGTRVSIRGATPRDAEKLRAMFSRVALETIYLRFHVPYPDVPERTLALMLGVDHPDKGSLVAVAEGEIVGHAMYARLGDGGEAEMAIIVEDGWQSNGVGKSLLSELAQRARLRGVDTFTGEVLGENRRMLGLAAIFAGTDYTLKDGVYHVRMPLGKPNSATYPARTLRRAA